MKIYIFLLRISLGILFFYAGLTKILNPNWSASGYLKGAQTFSEFYNFLLQPAILPIINFINTWGLTLLGVSLLLGVAVRLSSRLGALLMLLYYIPILKFPYAGTNSFLVDQHIIYIISLLLLGSAKAGRFWGLEKWCSSLPICSKYPKLRELLG
ncbi:MAG: DoxX family membrane protein [Candidatus Levybacteria bacterium]|nr:DoxX family membrane protein [Candidatus Levybacteria bacterium]